MKYISKISLIILALTSLNFYSQDDECKKKVSLYTIHVKDKNYTTAWDFWKDAQSSCPDYKENLYRNGEFIANQLKNQTTDKNRIEQLNDTVLWMYEEIQKRFGEKGELYEEKALMYFNNKKDFEKACDNFKLASNMMGNKMSSTSIVYYAFCLTTLKKDNKIETDEIVKEYEILSNIISANSDNPDYQNAQKTVDSYLGVYLSCDNLIPLIEKNHSKAVEDTTERLKYLQYMDRANCTDNKYYKEFVELEINRNPTEKGFIQLAKIKKDEGKTSDALSYIEKAIGLTSSSSDKIKYMKLAMNWTSSDGSYINRILSINPNDGDMLLIKAQNFSQTNCGATPFERKAVYWAAYDKALHAKNIDPSCAANANRLISSFQSRFPTSQEMFEAGVQRGQSYTTCAGVTTTAK